MCLRLFTFNLSITDLVAAKGRYHTRRINFENPIPKHASLGRSPSSGKLTTFKIICDQTEDDFKLYTVKQLHGGMEKLGHDVYSSKMTKKLKRTYFY